MSDDDKQSNSPFVARDRARSSRILVQQGLSGIFTINRANPYLNGRSTAATIRLFRPTMASRLVL